MILSSPYSSVSHATRKQTFQVKIVQAALRDASILLLLGFNQSFVGCNSTLKGENTDTGEKGIKGALLALIPCKQVDTG